MGDLLYTLCGKDLDLVEAKLLPEAATCKTCLKLAHDEYPKKIRASGQEPYPAITTESSAVEALSEAITAGKEKLLKEAITHVQGKCWTIDDISGRGEFKIDQDGTEVFYFDGIPLIVFYRMKHTIGTSGIGIDMKTLQQYRLLYEKKVRID